jgi:uncharacterized protein YcbK (DUF882 family)
MSNRNFAGAKPRPHWSHCISTLPANKPVLWTSAAVVISIFAVGFIAVASKVTATHSRPFSATPQPFIVAQAFQELDIAQPDPPTVAVRPVAPMIFHRPAEVMSQPSQQVATAGSVGTVAQAPREQMTAMSESGTQSWPKALNTASNAAAPTECLPEALRTVLTELQSRFGPVTIVSTTQLHTDNHSAGSARASMHSACKAVDFKTSHEPQDVMAFLRSRPEVGGVNSYRNKVIHFDLNAGYQAAGRSRGTQPRRAFARSRRQPRMPESAMAQEPDAEQAEVRTPSAPDHAPSTTHSSVQ